MALTAMRIAFLRVLSFTVLVSFFVSLLPPLFNLRAAFFIFVGSVAAYALVPGVMINVVLSLELFRCTDNHNRIQSKERATP
jgi:hypothetical protein